MAICQKTVCLGTYERVNTLKACTTFGDGWKRGPKGPDDNVTDHWCCGESLPIVKQMMSYALQSISDQVGAFADMQILHQRLFRVTDREFYVGWVRLCPTEEPAFQEAFELLHKRAAVLRSRRPMSDC